MLLNLKEWVFCFPAQYFLLIILTKALTELIRENQKNLKKKLRKENYIKC